MRTDRAGLLLILAAACAGRAAPVAGPAAPPATGALGDDGGGAALGDRLATAGEIAELRERVARLEAVAAARTPTLLPQGEPGADVVHPLAIADAPNRGGARARVVMVKAYEYACSFCKRSRATEDQLLAAYGEDLRIVYRHFIVHPIATEPAILACAAHRQGKFAAVDALLWQAHDGAADDPFGAAALKAIARTAGLDRRRLAADQAACKEVVRRDQEELAAAGTGGTPTFYVNGRRLVGAQPVEQFRALIDEERTRASERLAADPTLTVADYYRRFVLEARPATPP